MAVALKFYFRLSDDSRTIKLYNSSLKRMGKDIVFTSFDQIDWWLEGYTESRGGKYRLIPVQMK